VRFFLYLCTDFALLCQNGRKVAFWQGICKEKNRKKYIYNIMKQVSTKKLVETIIEGIQNRKGQRIITVDLRKLEVAPAEYFIIAEGGSNTQVAAIADEVDSFVRTQTHVHPLFVDGRDNAEWIVLDYGNIFVHIMQREPRAYYDIEHLWADGKITEIPEV
jgi:ribosome-associated protein